ncbi:hypothetical protein ACX80W_10860 [Arthrobacter sp. TMN-37]
MKKWQLGWRMMTPPQKAVTAALIACAIVALVLPEIPFLIRVAGLGALGAWLLARPRRQRPLHYLTVDMEDDLSPYREPTHEVLTAADRASIRTAGWYNGCRMAEGKTNRAGALQRMRDTIPGLPAEHYEAGLDEALMRIEAFKAEVRDRRARLVAEARESDALNAVFALHYYNRRYSRHVGQYGLGEIDLEDALGDLFSRKQIHEKVMRSDALIEEGIRMGRGSWDHEPNMAHLRQTHPGFNDQALSDALGWGHVMHR